MAAHCAGGIRRGAESERSLDSSQQNQWKKAAAEAAAKLVEDGMIVGLGTGSTATYFVNALAKRVAHEHLHISGIPTSQKTAALARSLKIPLSTFAAHTQIDLTVDGADEVERGTLYLIKGHGGALLREKIVAAASKRMAIVVDETKLVDRLSGTFVIDGKNVSISPSIGIALFHADVTSAEMILEQADLAMYRAKAAGRKCYRWYAAGPAAAQAGRT